MKQPRRRNLAVPEFIKPSTASIDTASASLVLNPSIDTATLSLEQFRDPSLESRSTDDYPRPPIRARVRTSSLEADDEEEIVLCSALCRCTARMCYTSAHLTSLTALTLYLISFRYNELLRLSLEIHLMLCTAFAAAGRIQ